MDAETRAVMLRLVEASKVMDECYCEASPYLNDPTRAKHRKALIEFRAAITKARTLLDAQPAGKDAWLETANNYAEALGIAYYLATMAKDSFTSGLNRDEELIDAQKNVGDHKQRLFTHLRSHPAAPEGFVLVRTDDYAGTVPARWRYLVAELQKRFPHPNPFDSTKTPEEYALEAIDRMIAAAGKE